MNIVNEIRKEKVSIKVQTLAALCAIALAVAIPQIFHLAGSAAGVGSALGEIFLPMHLPIMLVALFAGPYAGAAAGLLAPLVSFLLTGMPSSLMLPYIMIELCVYGIACGAMRNVKCPTVLKVLTAQVAGRAVRAVAILLGVFAFGSTVSPEIIFKSIVVGLVGIALQLIIVPLVTYRVNSIGK